MDIYLQEIPAYIYCHRNLVTGQFYFGYRMRNIKLGKMPEVDFPKYITSGKIKADIIANPHDWQSEILQEFFGDTREDDAFWAEQALIKESWSNPQLLNKHYNDQEKSHKIWRKKIGPNNNSTKKVECRHCQKLIGNTAIARHEIACEMNYERKTTPQKNPSGPRGTQKNPAKKFECRHCQELRSSSGIGRHEMTCEMNPERKTILASKQSATKSKFEWKEKNSKTCDHCGDLFSLGMYNRWHGDKCRQKIVN